MGVNLFSKNNKHILQYIIADVDLKDCKDCKKKLFFHLYNSHSKKYIPIQKKSNILYFCLVLYILYLELTL